MKCQECGHDYSSSIPRCTRCGHLTSEQNQTPSSSRLIEFPRKVRRPAAQEQKAAPLPEWRLELKERVRAVRSKRNGEPDHSGDTDRDFEAQSSLVACDQSPPSNKSAPQTREPRTKGRNAIIAGNSSLDSNIGQEPPAQSVARSNHHIADAAIARVRRASEKANRALLPKIEPARPIQQGAKGAIVTDKQATARALEPAIEIKHRHDPIKEESSKSSASSALPSRAMITAEAPRPLIESRLLPEPDDSFTSCNESALPDEIEPMDYLEAEVRRFGNYQGEEGIRAERLSISKLAILTITDLLIIAVSSAPFLALIELFNGNFTSPENWLATGAIILMIAYFYLGLTQSLCARTFGMMLTNTRVFTAKTNDPITVPRALARTFIFAPAFALCWLWAVLNPTRRGLHDIISGTVVTDDFD